MAKMWPVCSGVVPIVLVFGVWLVGDGYKWDRDGPVTRPRGP